MLNSYAEVFNAVEGNTTFYHTPDSATVDRWLDALSGTELTISFKLPSEVTHQKQPDERVLQRFMESIRPLKPHLGPFLLQFPHWAGIEFLTRFERLFNTVAEVGSAVVEVRHTELFEQPQTLEPLLNRYGFGRAILDTRALYQGDLAHPEVVNAIHEKPDLPVLTTLYNNKAFVRLMLHPNGQNDIWMEEWVDRTWGWINQGVETVMMIHCPNNFHCPAFAQEFHERLCVKANGSIAALPAWPVPQQGSLL